MRAINVILLLLIANEARAICVQVPNEDMVEYSCDSGHPYDLYTIPERTEKIRIANINLPQITRDTFARFGDNLWVLACSNCGIQEIDSDAFRSLTSLQQLRLDNNRISTIKASWFEGLNLLTYLDFNYNQIRTIEPGVFDNLPSLTDLRIAGNKLECLNIDEISRLSDLQRIFLNHNPQFKCPNAVARVLEAKQVNFEPDPEWRSITEDLVHPETTRASYEWSSTARERISLRPTDASVNYPASSTRNYPTSTSTEDYSTPEQRLSTLSAPWYVRSTTEQPLPRVWPSTLGYTSSREPSEPPEILRTSTHDSYSDSGPYEPYYPPQIPRTTLEPVPEDLPTSTARISWSYDSEDVAETDLPPVATYPPPTGPPLHEENEPVAVSRPQMQPLGNYQQVDEVKAITDGFSEPTTDKPLPECNRSTARGVSGALVLVILALRTI